MPRPAADLEVAEGEVGLCPGEGPQDADRGHEHEKPADGLLSSSADAQRFGVAAAERDPRTRGRFRAGSGEVRRFRSGRRRDGVDQASRRLSQPTRGRMRCPGRSQEHPRRSKTPRHGGLDSNYACRRSAGKPGRRRPSVVRSDEETPGGARPRCAMVAETVLRLAPRDLAKRSPSRMAVLIFFSPPCCSRFAHAAGLLCRWARRAAAGCRVHRHLRRHRHRADQCRYRPQWSFFGQ
jgi:hypothetical protein